MSRRITARSHFRHVFVLALIVLAGFARMASADITIFVVADTHFGPDVPDSSQQNLLEAINHLPGTPYPPTMGGAVVQPPDAVFVCGDLVHEDGNPNDFFGAYAGNGCSGAFPWPVYECAGNHDLPVVRSLIEQRHGELLYGIDVGGVFFQSLDDMPTVDSIAYVNDRLSALAPGTPIVLFHHRPLSASPGYIDEWAPEAVDAYRNMVAGKNVIAVLFGHDHYSRHYVWEGIDTYTPGSVRHSPGTRFPESLVVIRITSTNLVAASWVFGNDVLNNQHYWVGGAWSWTHVKTISTPALISVAAPEVKP